MKGVTEGLAEQGGREALEKGLRGINVEPEDFHALLVGQLVNPGEAVFVGCDGHGSWAKGYPLRRAPTSSGVSATTPGGLTSSGIRLYLGQGECGGGAIEYPISA